MADQQPLNRQRLIRCCEVEQGRRHRFTSRQVKEQYTRPKQIRIEQGDSEPTTSLRLARTCTTNVLSCATQQAVCRFNYEKAHAIAGRHDLVIASIVTKPTSSDLALSLDECKEAAYSEIQALHQVSHGCLVSLCLFASVLHYSVQKKSSQARCVSHCCPQRTADGPFLHSSFQVRYKKTIDGGPAFDRLQLS